MLQQWQQYDAHKAMGTAHTKTTSTLSQKSICTNRCAQSTTESWCTNCHQWFWARKVAVGCRNHTNQRINLKQTKLDTTVHLLDKLQIECDNHYFSNTSTENCKKLEECTSPSSLVILFLSNLLLEHLNHPIYSLLRVLQNKCVRSATFAHLNNGRQRNTFWQTFSSNYMLAEYVFPFPPLLCYKQLCEQFLQTNSSCKQD